MAITTKELSVQLEEVTKRLHAIESSQHVMTSSPGLPLTKWNDHGFVHRHEIKPLVRAINNGGGSTAELEERIEGLESGQTVLTSSMRAVEANQLVLTSVTNRLHTAVETLPEYSSFAEIPVVHGFTACTVKTTNAVDGPYKGFAVHFKVIVLADLVNNRFSAIAMGNAMSGTSGVKGIGDTFYISGDIVDGVASYNGTWYIMSTQAGMSPNLCTQDVFNYLPEGFSDLAITTNKVGHYIFNSGAIRLLINFSYRIKATKTALQSLVNNNIYSIMKMTSGYSFEASDAFRAPVTIGIYEENGTDTWIRVPAMAGVQKDYSGTNGRGVYMKWNSSYIPSSDGPFYLKFSITASIQYTPSN